MKVRESIEAQLRSAGSLDECSSRGGLIPVIILLGLPSGRLVRRDILWP
jgi:hypothetical protein